MVWDATRYGSLNPKFCRYGSLATTVLYFNRFSTRWLKGRADFSVTSWATSHILQSLLRSFDSNSMKTCIALAFACLLTIPPALSRQASITEEIRSLETYTFGDPNDVPILTKDTRLYPYHSFEGYSHRSEPMNWKVVKLENEFIEVFVLPDAGGKVWGAIEKASGEEFIYRNEVMKFRNISLRGPWTSGGIEFNFGVIGHTPSTATPVDYVLIENPDGSVSCWVGALDLPSRFRWRVEVRLPANASYFETNVYWNNPTSLVQPYYNWMTAAAFAQYDLEMAIPGNQYLKHSGERKTWPYDDQDRFLPEYANNQFEGHKSYHVVGEYNDYFGGYYKEDDYGFGHWARFEDMPGQKLWLWALSRQGGVWTDLLTDTDGQYVEYQAGRQFVQYSPGAHANPITKAGFQPLTTDTWSERWFPVLGTGGISDASENGVMHVTHEGDKLRVRMNSFVSVSDSLKVWSEGLLLHHEAVETRPLELWETTIPTSHLESFTVSFDNLDLRWSTNDTSRDLERPFILDDDARPAIPEVDRNVFEGRELMKARRYPAARLLFQDVLDVEPWNRDALVEMANLDLREAHFMEGLTHALKALQLDAHDADANFVAGALYEAIDRPFDARDSYSWAARSMAYRSSANARIADIALRSGRMVEALEFSERSLNYDAHNVSALEVAAVTQRLLEQAGGATLARIESFDALNHFARAERFLSGDSDWKDFADGINNEFPDQTILEIAIRYHHLGQTNDALRILEARLPESEDAIIALWAGYLSDNPDYIDAAADIYNATTRPYRVESLAMLDWVIEEDSDWKWLYLKGLNLWALNQPAEALPLWDAIRYEPDHAAFYVARALLAKSLSGRDSQPDLIRAVQASDSGRLTEIYLIRHYQETGQWHKSLDRSGVAIGRYIGDFNLELLHARALIFLGESLEAVEVMETTRVLPSENARDSHALFVAAHLMAAMDALEEGDQTAAAIHAERALEWPERLGQGRPYEPDERQVRYILALANGENATLPDISGDALTTMVATRAATFSEE